MIPTRTLGRTARQISMIGLGGYHLGTLSDEATAVRLLRRAIDEGITFLDNSWDYHDGKSERWMGAALRDGYRERVFLMTKIDGRTQAAAEQQINDSLRRLGTDHIDLIQHHEVIRFEDADRIFADGGAMEAVRAAQQAGKVGFVGFTGHKDPAIHLRTLEVADAHGFTFDTVQMPLNCLDAHFRSFETHVLPLLVARGIGVIGMKPIAAGRILESHTVTAPECLRYALSLPTSVVVTGIDAEPILDQALDVARTFRAMTDTERAALLARTAAPARRGHLEAFKTTTDHDSTTQHVEWLG